jgi:hypothetical protein
MSEEERVYIATFFSSKLRMYGESDEDVKKRAARMFNCRPDEVSVRLEGTHEHREEYSARSVVKKEPWE